MLQRFQPLAIVRRRYGPSAVAIQPSDPHEERRNHDVERWGCSEERSFTGHVKRYAVGCDDAFDGYFAYHRCAAEEVVDADACVFDPESGFISGSSMYHSAQGNLQRPLVIQPSLPRLIEAVVKSLDPNAAGDREATIDAATEILMHVVQTYGSLLRIFPHRN